MSGDPLAATTVVDPATIHVADRATTPAAHPCAVTTTAAMTAAHPCDAAIALRPAVMNGVAMDPETTAVHVMTAVPCAAVARPTVTEVAVTIGAAVAHPGMTTGAARGMMTGVGPGMTLADLPGALEEVRDSSVIFTILSS